MFRIALYGKLSYILCAPTILSYRIELSSLRAHPPLSPEVNHKGRLAGDV